MSGRLVVGIDRSKDGAYAVAWVQQILDDPARTWRASAWTT